MRLLLLLLCTSLQSFSDSNSVTFFGKDYISYRIRSTAVQPLKRQVNSNSNYVTAQNIISLSFITSVGSGSVLQLGDSRQSSEFLMLEVGKCRLSLKEDNVIFSPTQIVSGYLQLRYNLGGGLGILPLRSARVNDATAHTVTVTRTEGSFELVLDDTFVNRTTTPGDGDDIVLNISPSHVFLGGEVVVGAGEVVQGFSGCLIGVRLDRKEFPFIASGNDDFEVNNFPSGNVVVGCPIRTLIERNQSNVYVFGGLGGILGAMLLISAAFVFVCAMINACRRSRRGEASIHRQSSSRTASPNHSGFQWQPARPTHSLTKVPIDRKDLANENSHHRERSLRPRTVVVGERNEIRLADRRAAHDEQQNRQISQTTSFHSRPSSRQSGRSQSVPVPVEGFSAVNQLNQGYVTESSANSDREEEGENRFVRHMRSVSGQLSLKSNKSDATYIPSELLHMDDIEVAKYIKKKVKLADDDNEAYNIDKMTPFNDEGKFKPLGPGSLESLYDIVLDLDSSVMSVTISPPQSPTHNEVTSPPLQLHSPTTGQSKLPQTVSSKQHSNPIPVHYATPTTSPSVHPQRTHNTNISPKKSQMSPPKQQVRPITIKAPSLSRAPPPPPPPGEETKSHLHGSPKKSPPPFLHLPQSKTPPSPTKRVSAPTKSQNSWIPIPMTNSVSSSSQPDYHVDQSEQQKDTSLSQGSSQSTRVEVSRLRRSARGSRKRHQNMDNILEKFHNITSGTPDSRGKEEIRAL